MIQILTSTIPENLGKILWVANQLSLITNRYESGEALSQTIAEVQKHTTEDIYWVNYTEMYPHLGDIGRLIADMLTGVTPSGEPNMNINVFKVEEFESEEDLITQKYLPPTDEPV